VSTEDAAGRVFAALADPTRREVVRRLAAEGPLTATELAGPTRISRQAVAKHLRALAMAGLAIGTHEGRETRFELRTAAFAEAEAWMRAVGASWTLRLDALRTLVEHPDLRVVPEP
jgi:ArsR family transcriptional regulator, cadmium/lead-responsive transcriptional repressor